MATTRSRPPRGREHARPSTGGVAADHATKIYLVGGLGIAIIVAFLALTSIGHVVDAATQHFMLYYAGVFALIALCASVGLGLVATDRLLLNPAHRVFIQSAHRAASFGAVTFLIIHIVTEILAQRVRVIDAVVPFLSPFRTFYIGLGTIASDLIILLVITGIMRSRFTAHGNAWRWRAIHYTSYVAFVFGIWHGLLGGRPAKPYVDWSYGFVIAFVVLGLAVRILSNSLKPRQSLSTPPVDMSAASAAAPMRAAAMFAQLGAARGRIGDGFAVTGQARQAGFAPVGAPVLTALPAGSADADPREPYYEADPRQPYYEPGYEGPARFLGAPAAPPGPAPRPAAGQLPRAATGPMPRPGTGPMPRAATGPMPGNPTGPIPRTPTGPIPRTPTGPIPRAASGPITGPWPADRGRPQGWPSGPMPQAAGNPFPDGGPRYPDGQLPPGEWAEGGYPGAPPWDGGAPEPDPAFRYRAPGPGMPGYRGSRDHRYGGDRH